MICQTYEESMMKFFDGELNDIETAQLKQHFKSCQKCGKEFEELSSILGCIQNDFDIEPPLDFEAQVMSRISTLQAVEIRKPGVIKILLLVTGAILTFLAASALVYSILGISIFSILSRLLSDSPVFANIFESAGTAFEGGISSIIDYSKTVFEVLMVLAKTYYYFVVLSAVLLFALQWMVFGLVKQNILKAKQAMPNIN
jgi:hypothetical protein